MRVGVSLKVREGAMRGRGAGSAPLLEGSIGGEGTAVDLIEANFSPLECPSNERDPIVGVGFG